MKLKQTALSLLTGTKIGERIVSDQRYRIVLSAAVSFVINLLYALYHCVLGIMNLSLWFTAMCAYYGILAVMRFSAVLCEYKNKQSSCDRMETFVMRLSGVLLSALSLVLATIIYISLSQNIAVRYGEIIMITIAAYTFCKITMAVVKAVKQRRNSSPLLKTIRSISYAEVAASVLTLQRSMLVSFDPVDAGQNHFMNAAAGAAVCLFVLILGISVTVSSTRKEDELWQNQN